MTDKLRHEYPEIGAYLSRSNKQSNNDLNANYQSWLSARLDVNGTSVIVRYDPGTPQSLMDSLDGIVRRAKQMVKAAGFEVPQFYIYLPKYGRSLNVGLVVNAFTSTEELRVTPGEIEDDDEAADVELFN